jgi:hypothetical protein
MKEHYEKFEIALQEFLNAANTHGFVINWALLIDYVPDSDPDGTGFACFYKDGTIRWASALGLNHLWKMKLEQDFNGADRD